MIPESVKKEIEEKSKVHESATPHEGLGPALFSEGAAFGYSLASEEIERLKGLLEELFIDKWRVDRTPTNKPLSELIREFKQKHNL